VDVHVAIGTIEESVQAILESSAFRSSKQCQTLLRYIIDHSVSGQNALLRERVIGTAVFGRAPDYDYDCGNDPVVRARVNEVRKRLAQYYEGHRSNASIHISIPSGSYVAVFDTTNTGSVEIAQKSPDEIEDSPVGETRPTALVIGEGDKPQVEALPVLPAFTSRPLSQVWALVALATCILVLAVLVVAGTWHRSELYLLWSPILESKKTVFLYTGTVGPLYRRTDPIARTNSIETLDLPAVPSPVSAIETQGPDVRAFESVGGNLAPPADIAADLKVAALMNSYSRSISLRSGEGLQFADLKDSPAVLIGAYDNYWTLDLARELPFFLDRGVRIRERNGQHRAWSSVKGGSDAALVEDYAIVFRLLDSKTGGPIIAIAGLTTCATQAAAEFATDPVQLKKLVGIPRDVLAHRNIEFVLHASLVNCTPASTEIVAQQYW
jgi:hypothetical protein